MSVLNYTNSQPIDSAVVQETKRETSLRHSLVVYKNEVFAITDGGTQLSTPLYSIPLREVSGDNARAVCLSIVEFSTIFACIGFNDGTLCVIQISENKIVFNHVLSDEEFRAIKLIPTKSLRNTDFIDILCIYNTKIVHINGESLEYILKSTSNAVSQLKLRKYDVTSENAVINDAFGFRMNSFSKKSYSSEFHSSDVFDSFGDVLESTDTFRYVTVGQTPFLSSYVTTDGQAKFSVIDLGFTVAKNVTSIVYTLAKSWWYNADTPVSDPTDERHVIAQSTAIDLYPRSALEDANRSVLSITVCPLFHERAYEFPYALCCDSLSRVLLVDIVQTCVIRMWKGYRTAQCAWLLNDTNRRLYAVIYAPYRGLLEVWSVPYGDRICAVSVGKCQLLQSTVSADVQCPKVYLLRCEEEIMHQIVLHNI